MGNCKGSIWFSASIPTPSLGRAVDDALGNDCLIGVDRDVLDHDLLRARYRFSASICVVKVLISRL